jgi:hypothetical protein
MDSPQTPPSLPPPPGWYPDPEGQGMRWWDGFQWTGHRHGGAAQAPPSGQHVPRVPRQKWWHIPLVVTVGVMGTLLYIAAQFID